MTDEDLRNNLDYALFKLGVIDHELYQKLPRFLTTPTGWPWHDNHVVVPNPLTGNSLLAALEQASARCRQKVEQFTRQHLTLATLAQKIAHLGPDRVVADARQVVEHELAKQTKET